MTKKSSPFVPQIEAVEELASRWSVSPESIRRWLAKGQLDIRAVRVGPRSIRYRRSDLDRLVSELEAA